jgi:hypothetical protein
MTIKSLGALVVGAALSVCVSLASISVLARDSTTKYERPMTCAEVNLIGGQVPADQCVITKECVFCFAIPAPPTGDKVSESGAEKMNRPEQLACYGERRIGVCTGTGGVQFCDLSQGRVEGECGGVVKRYQPQAIDP